MQLTLDHVVALAVSPIDEASAPGALLRPVRGWFESLLSDDWERHAEAFPSLDLSHEEATRRVEEARTAGTPDGGPTGDLSSESSPSGGPEA